MVDVGKVSQWVKKAVADIAAFDGNLRRIDTEAEKNALGALLAGNLSEEDKDYIEGFMIDRRGRVEKIDGKRPEKNEARTVEVYINEPISGPSDEYVQKYKEMRQTAKVFFDENGRMIKNEVKGKNGEITSIRNLKYISENEIEATIEQKDLGGTVSSFRGISDLTKGEDGWRLLDHVVKDEAGEVLLESHETENGYMRRSIRFDSRGISLFPPDMVIPEEISGEVSHYEETCQDGVAILRYLDKDGNELYRKQGTYEMNEYGFISTKYPTK